jgi:DNA-binding MarR family transcriptional regulator
MTPYLLDQVGRAARSDLQSRMKNDLGISLRELWVLGVVDEGDTDTKAGAERLDLDRDAVGDLARALADRKLVERVGKHGLAPTKAGRRALSRARLAAGTVTGSVLGPLDPEERAQLHGLLARAYASLTHDDD